MLILTVLIHIPFYNSDENVVVCCVAKGKEIKNGEEKYNKKLSMVRIKIRKAL